MTPRYNRYEGRDDGPVLDGDTAWARMVMARNPMLLQRGEYAFGRNVRLRYGHPATRGGAVEMTWAQISPTADTGAVWASLSFRNPLGDSFFIKARSANAEVCDETGGCVTLPYPGGVTLSSEAFLVQLFNKVLLLRGPGLSALEWTPPSDWDDPFTTGFVAITQTGTGGADPIPSGIEFGILFKNRFLTPFNRDEVAASDVFNYTRYDPVLQQFKINQGDEQSVRGMVAGGRDAVVIFKDHSAFLLENFTGDLSAVTLDVLPVDIGLAPGAHRTLVRWGKDIFFLGADLGYYSLSQALDNRLQGDEKALSDDIEPLMESIAPTLVHKCVAKVWQKKLYLAVPLADEGLASANAILVYDFTAGGWVGVDTSELFEIQNLLVHPYQGKERLFMVHEDGRIFLLEEGYEDDGADIATEWISRGYTCGVEGEKAFQRGSATLSTWDPTYTIETGVNGGNV